MTDVVLLVVPQMVPHFPQTQKIKTQENPQSRIVPRFFMELLAGFEPATC